MQKKLNDDFCDEEVTAAVVLLFKNRLCLPAYPFKLLLHSLLNNETVTASPTTFSDYVSIPEEQTIALVKLAVFGESECVGAKHLSKLINSRSMKELKDMALSIKSAFGNQVANIKTERIEADFIEVFHVTSFLSQQIAQPRQHRVQMTVEIIVSGKGTFEECLTLFIRRILEDTHKSELSSLMISSVLRVCGSPSDVNASVQDIDIRTMKSKRQQVLTALKAAVVNDGDIWLEFYLGVDKTLLAFHADSVPYRESSSGFVHITRRYKLSYRNDKGEARCFSQMPMESTATGVFLSLREAQLYLSVCRDQFNRSKASTTTTTSTTNSTTSSDKTASFADFNALVTHLSGRILSLWGNGEAVNAAESMLLLQCLLVDGRKEVTHAMVQLRHLVSSFTGHIRAVRDALSSLSGCVRLLIDNVTHSTALANQTHDITLSGEESDAVEKLMSIFHRLSPAVSEVRNLVLELVRVQTHSELEHVAPYLTQLVWLLFDKTNKTVPVVHISLTDVSKRSLLSAVKVLLHVADTLFRLDSALKMVEVSVGTEIAVRLARQDLVSYTAYETHATRTKRSLDRPDSDVPRCFVDLLGYCISRQEYFSQAGSSGIAGGQNTKKSPVFVWRSLRFSDLLRSQLTLDNKQRTESEDRAALAASSEDTLPSASSLWDLYAHLGEYPYARLGGVDFVAAMEDEVARYDVPRFMAVEGAKIRYLEETLVVRALHEAAFFASTLPDKRPKYPRFCAELFRYPSFLQLWNGVEDATIEEFAFQCVRRDRMQSTSTHKDRGVSGAYKIDIRNLPTRLKHIVSGGVFASDRVLSAMGPRVDGVFQNVWNLPPMLPSPPVSSTVGISMKVFCGLAAETALAWCVPDIAKLKMFAATPSSDDEDEQLAHKHKVDKQSVFRSVAKGSSTLREVESALKREESVAAADVSVKEATKREPDPDLGQLRYSDTVQLEVVVKVSYEFSEGLTKVRSLFASEVSKCVRHLMSSDSWNLERAVVFREPQLTADLGTEDVLRNCRVFAQSDLADDQHHNETFPAMEAAVTKHGTCTLEGSMCVAEHESRLSTSDIVKIFEKLVVHSETGVASDQPYVASNKAKLTGKPTDFLAAQDGPNTFKAPHSSFGWHSDSKDSAEDVETDYQIDPTHSDADRICADSLVSQLIQKRYASGVKCFVPCRIRFTLLAQLTSRTTWKQSLLHTKPHYSSILGQQSNPLSVGSDHDVARLVASTLWFSHEASSAVWGCARSGEAHCITHEAASRWTAYRNCLAVGDVCRAYHHAFLSAVLTQNYQLVSPLFRAFNGIGFKLSRAIQCVSACRGILESSSVSQSDVVSLGLTISRYVCLTFRYLVVSPQCTHFRGGCAHLLQLVSQFESVLRLRPVELRAALTKLPTRLVPRDPTPSSATSDAAVIVTVKYRVESESKVPRAPPGGPPPAPSSTGVSVISNSQLDRNSAPQVLDNMSAQPTAVKRPVRAKNQVQSAEAEFRRALSVPRDLTTARDLLRSIEECAGVLLHALNEDIRPNFQDVEAALRQCPAMRSGRDVMDLLLGDDCDLDALLSFVHRGESATNKQLEDPNFAASLKSASGAQDYRGSNSADDAAGILKRISQLSENSTVHEKAALSVIVKSALKLHSVSGDSVPQSAGLLASSESVSSKLSTTEGALPSSAKPRTAPHLAKSVRLITSLLSGLKPKSTAAPLQISTEDFRNVMEGGHGPGDDSMQCTPDRALGASSSWDKLQQQRMNVSTPDSVGGDNRLRDAANKLNAAKMFSLHESADESDSPLPVVRRNKLVLSRFHDEESAEQLRVAERERLAESAVPYDHTMPSQAARVPLLQPPSSVSTPVQTFSSSGFNLVGDSVKDAAQSRSMLHLLRVYSGAQQQYQDHSVAQVSALNGKTSTASRGEREGVLHALRNLPTASRADDWQQS